MNKKLPAVAAPAVGGDGHQLIEEEKKDNNSEAVIDEDNDDFDERDITTHFNAKVVPDYYRKQFFSTKKILYEDSFKNETRNLPAREAMILKGEANLRKDSLQR